MRIYHLASEGEWAAARTAGEPYRRSTLDRSLEEEGFVHLSFAGQLRATADRFYAGREGIVLLTVDPARLASPLVVEASAGPGSEEFPHVYGPIDLDAVVAVTPTPVGADGRLVLPGLEPDGDPGTG